ncbi:hypothetical protein RJ641_007870, partial [Dillenia turbinata]
HITEKSQKEDKEDSINPSSYKSKERSHERLQISWGHDPSPLHDSPPPQNPDHEEFHRRPKNFMSWYLSQVYKILFILQHCDEASFLVTSIGIVWYMRYHKAVKQTQQGSRYLPTLHSNSPVFCVGSFDPPLFRCNGVAIFPQLLLLQRSRNIDNLTGNYISSLVLVVLFTSSTGSTVSSGKIINTDGFPWISGVIQTALYADFFYYYIKR